MATAQAAHRPALATATSLSRIHDLCAASSSAWKYLYRTQWTQGDTYRGLTGAADGLGLEWWGFLPLGCLGRSVALGCLPPGRVRLGMT